MQEDAKRKALITSKSLEEVYLKDPNDKLPFRSESHEYILNFKGMSKVLDLLLYVQLIEFTY